MINKIKTHLPKSLFGRFLLIIVLPCIIAQIFAVYMFYERHWSGVSKHMILAFTGDISMIVRNAHSLPLDERKKFLKSANDNLYLSVKFYDNKRISNVDKNPELQELTEALSSIIKHKYVTYFTHGDSKIAIDVQMMDGLLHIVASKKRLVNPSTYIFIMWMIGAALLFLIISLLFMRNQVRSITNLAEAAQKFGMGGYDDEFKPTGAAEVRQVAESFIEMRDRIKKQIQQRTEMLAGVSHDLKTPITRIKLQLAMMKPTNEIKDLQEDILEMEKMIQGYIDFAKGKERVADSSVNISDLMRSIVAGYHKFDQNIALKTKNGIMLHVNSNDMRRVISNIIDNSLRYGKNISITIGKSEKNAIIMIDDDGPGIPIKEREKVFKPFYRIDNSRHLESGSTGLGLAIAKDIISSYGGDISLDKSQMGGLQVIIKMPL